MRQQRTGQHGAAGASLARREAGKRPPAGQARQPERGAAEGAASGAAKGKGSSGLAVLFLLSLLPPTSFHIGPLLMKPYRIVLLVLFVPLLVRLCSGAAGRMMAIDWLMIGACVWAALALVMNDPLGETIEPIGVIFLELLGAYMVARLCIRSAEDFRRVVKVLFVIILVLLGFAAIESVTHRPILMQLIESSLVANQEPRFGLRRAQTVFVHPIAFGVFVSAGLGMAWFALRPDASFARRGLCALTIGLATFFSLSTGALIAFAMQCVFIAWELAMRPDPRRWRIFAWGAFAGYVLIDMLSSRSPFHVLVSYASFNTGSAYNRILIWRYGTQNVADNPIFGLGLNDWVRPDWMSPSADNFWLLMTMRYGLPFIFMFAGGLLLLLRRVSRQALTDGVDRACRAGYLTTFGGIVIAGGTIHYWQTMFAFVMFLFGSGVWIITGGAKTADPDPGPDPGPRDRRALRGRRAGPGEEAPRRKRPIL